MTNGQVRHFLVALSTPYTRTCSNPILRYGIRRVYWHSQRRRNPGLRSGGMTAGDSIFVGKGGGEAQALLLKYANRHGLIAGATGTGKTVSLQVLAEGFSKAGVPVFLADVKGDLAGISQAG